MKSTKLTYITCCCSGITLFLLGLFLIFNIQTTPQRTQDITTSPNSNNDSSSNDWIDNYAPGGDPINFLVLIKEASGLNTDTILVANYDPDTQQVSLLTVPRDTKSSNNDSFKVNSSYYLGLNKYDKSQISTKEKKHKAAEYATQIISNLTNITIDYYVYFEIDTIKEIIDKLGGVYFDVPADLKYSDPTQDLYINLKKGYQLLDGDKAEQLLRFRKPHNLSKASADLRKFYDGSDLKRTEMQVRFVNEFIQQKVNLLNLSKFIPIIRYTFDNVITNVSLSDTLNLFSGFTKATRPEMNTFKLYGLDKELYDYYYFVYINKIEDTKTRDIYKSQQIIDKYFISDSGTFIPDKNKKYDYQAIMNTNPSNSESDSTGNGVDKP